MKPDTRSKLLADAGQLILDADTSASGIKDKNTCEAIRDLGFALHQMLRVIRDDVEPATSLIQGTEPPSPPASPVAELPEVKTTGVWIVELEDASGKDPGWFITSGSAGDDKTIGYHLKEEAERAGAENIGTGYRYRVRWFAPAEAAERAAYRAGFHAGSVGRSSSLPSARTATEAELSEQRKSWARGESAMGSDADEAKDRSSLPSGAEGKGSSPLGWEFRKFRDAYNHATDENRDAFDPHEFGLLAVADLAVKQERTRPPNPEPASEGAWPTVEEWEALKHSADFNLLSREAFRKLAANRRPSGGPKTSAASLRARQT